MKRGNETHEEAFSTISGRSIKILILWENFRWKIPHTVFSQRTTRKKNHSSWPHPRSSLSPSRKLLQILNNFCQLQSTWKPPLRPPAPPALARPESGFPSRAAGWRCRKQRSQGQHAADTLSCRSA